MQWNRTTYYPLRPLRSAPSSTESQEVELHICLMVSPVISNRPCLFCFHLDGCYKLYWQPRGLLMEKFQDGLVTSRYSSGADGDGISHWQFHAQINSQL